MVLGADGAAPGRDGDRGRIVDIGANTGFYSLIGLCADPHNQVLAFEPDPAVLPILRENVHLNAVNKRVVVEPVALSNEVGEASLYIPLQNHGCVETSSSLDAAFKGVHSKVVKVPVNTLDRYMRDDRPQWLRLFRRSSAQAVSLIKIDVEGHERSAFEGCVETIKRHRPIIFIELLVRADFAYFTELKDRLGYVSLRLRPDEVIEAGTMTYDEQAWNHVLVPQERRDAFKSTVEGLGLPMRMADI